MTRSRTWTIGTVAVILVAFAAGWFLLISPKRTEASELHESAAAAVAQNSLTEAKIRQLKLQQKQLPAQRAEIAQIQQQLPAEPQLPALIRQLSDAADEANLNLVGIEPSAIAPLSGASGVSYIPVNVSAVGDYTQIRQFLFALEENKRSVMITGVDVAPAEGESTGGATEGDLAVTLQSRVFMATEAAPATAQAPAATGTSGGVSPMTDPAASAAAN